MTRWLFAVLCLLLAIGGVRVVHAQNWNAVVLNPPYNQRVWDGAAARAYWQPTLDTAPPYGPQYCSQMPWQIKPANSSFDGLHTYTEYIDVAENCGKMGVFGIGSYDLYICDSNSVWGYDTRYGWGCWTGYYLALPGDNASDGACSCEQGRVANSHPIEFGTGNMSESANDFVSGDGLLRFDRYYNSNPLNPDNGYYGWQNAYAMRHIYPLSKGVKSQPPNVTAPTSYMSSTYPTASAACEQGIAEIAGGVNPNPAYNGVTATYMGNGQCQLSTGVVASVFNTNGGVAYSTPMMDASAGFAVIRPDGSNYFFTCYNGACRSSGQSEVTLVATSSGFTLTAENGDIETYDLNGNLLSIVRHDGYSQIMTNTVLGSTNVAQVSTVTDSYGRVLTFTYSDAGLITKLTLPDQTFVQYGYDGLGRLISVTYPDNSVVSYQYTNTNFPQALTAWIDESNNSYVTWGYDNTSGMAVSSAMAGNVDTNTLTYGANATTVTDNLGVLRTYNYQDIAGAPRLISVSGPVCKHCMGQSMTYDANGFLKSALDWNGNTTSYSYGATGLLQQRVDGVGSVAQRTTTISWNVALRVPLSRTVSNGGGTVLDSSQWAYNTNGQALVRCDIDPTNSAALGYSCSASGTVPAGVRRWTYTYCTEVDTTQCPLVGLMLAATGPRTDLTQTTIYNYYMSGSAVNCDTPGAACYQAGNLHTITDALGHVTTIASYDADGRITRITDANGVNTDMTYTPRGWLASRSVGGALTLFTYTAYGAVQTVTDPDGVTTTYGYDPAHRLNKITDALGNYIQYTLDAAGNKTGEQVYDGTGALHKQLTRTFNTLGQLTTVVDGLNQTVFNASAAGSYDGNGNLVQSSDGLGIQRQLGYDALNRLVQTLDNYNGTDTATQNTKTAYQYDSLDRLTQVTDPSNLNTTYSYDGLSDATGQVSPDTGATNRTFDGAGNVLTRTDAKGITATTSYDALNRPLTVSYPDSTQNITYSYDDPNSTTSCSTSYPVGRLTRIIENTVTTIYCYDARGNVIQKQQTLNGTTDTTGYGITAAGRLGSIAYPSGTHVTYARDGDGRIQTVTVTPPNGTAGMAVGSVTYQPFGPVSGYTLGNGQVIARTYDANYRLTDLTSPAFNLHVARDAMGDITAIGNAPGANPATETYGYDPLYRLTTVTEANGSVLESVTYNQTGDRLSKTGSGLATGAYSYNPNTHQLIGTGNAARTVDANGNTTAISQAGNPYGFGYSDRNRITVAQLAGNTVGAYTYNALNQRVQKVASNTTERYGYNEGSQMLDEYGATNRDYVWLGNLPVANVDILGAVSAVAYVTADQLGTPRAVANSGGTTEWQSAYQGNPWNEQAPITTGYTYNFGFPGQYFDAETGLSNNINRDYDSSTGRYVQSDPVGMFGGQVSTYAYVAGSPLDNTDPIGLIVKVVASDPAVAQTLMDAYAYLNAHSSTARSIDSDLENSSTVYKIEPTNDMDNDEYCPTNDTLGCEGHAHTVFVDICNFPEIPTTAGMQPITLPVLIGHELGHAWGYEDNTSPTDPLGDNVRLIENPIRQELGLPLRTRY